MRSRPKTLACCALCVLLGAFQEIPAQTVGVSKKRVPADPNESALNGLLAAAQAAIERKDYQAAAQNYQDFLAKHPDEASVHFQLGYTYTAMQRPAEATAEYEKAISLDPNMTPAYLNLGLTLLENDANAAVAPLKRAAELSPDQARPRFLLGLALERSGGLPAAIEQYEAAEKLDDQDFNTRFALGRALLSADRPSDAEAQFRAALLLRSDSGPAHLSLAECLVAEKKLEAAVAELAAYLETKPNDAQARVERASALVSLGRDDDALGELDRAAEAGPEGVRALELRSQVYFEKNRFDDAVPVLQKAVGLAPQDPEIPARLGHIFLKKRDYPNAVRELIIAFKMSPGATDVLGDLVAAQYLNKNYPAALEGLDLLSKRESLPAGSWFIRATCYDRLGQPAQALDAYQRFLQLNKDQNNDMYFEATARARTLTRELQNKR
jgi:tetratricopeptide (TPR) repeat protein